MFITENKAKRIIFESVHNHRVEVRISLDNIREELRLKNERVNELENRVNDMGEFINALIDYMGIETKKEWVDNPIYMKPKHIQMEVMRIVKKGDK